MLLHQDCKSDSQDTDHSKDWFQIPRGCVDWHVRALSVNAFRGWARSEEDLAGEDLAVQAMGSAARASSKLPDSIVACNDDFETCMWRSSVEEAFRGSSRSATIDHETIVVPAHSERTIVRVSRVFWHEGLICRRHPLGSIPVNSARLTGRSTVRRSSTAPSNSGVVFTPSEARSGEVDGGDVRRGRRLLPSPAIAACITSAMASACALPPSETLSCSCIRGAARFIGVVAC